MGHGSLKLGTTGLVYIQCQRGQERSWCRCFVRWCGKEGAIPRPSCSEGSQVKPFVLRFDGCQGTKCIPIEKTKTWTEGSKSRPKFKLHLRARQTFTNTLGPWVGEHVPVPYLSPSLASHRYQTITTTATRMHCSPTTSKHKLCQKLLLIIQNGSPDTQSGNKVFSPSMVCLSHFPNSSSFCTIKLSVEMEYMVDYLKEEFSQLSSLYSPYSVYLSLAL
jgi:hypothetical protein